MKTVSQWNANNGIFTKPSRNVRKQARNLNLKSEDSLEFSVGQNAKKAKIDDKAASFRTFLSTIDEHTSYFKYSTLANLPTIFEEFENKPYVAKMAPLLSKSTNRMMYFKSSKHGMDRIAQLKLNTGRVRTKPVLVKSSRVSFEKYRSIFSLHGNKELGVDSLYYTHNASLGGTVKQRKSVKKLRSIFSSINLNSDTVTDNSEKLQSLPMTTNYEIDNDIKFDSTSELTLPQQAKLDCGKGAYLFDCTVRGKRAKAFIDTGCINLPVNITQLDVATAYCSAEWANNSGLPIVDVPGFDVICASDKKVPCNKMIKGAQLNFGPYKETIDLFVFEGSNHFDIILGRQWFVLRQATFDKHTEALELPYKERTVVVPLSTEDTKVFNKGRYLGVVIRHFELDSDETEVYTDWKSFERANNKSYEYNHDKPMLYRVKITKNILGHDVEMHEPDQDVLAEFDPPDTDDYNARIPKTKNVIHDFESIENRRTPLQDKPITNELEQKVWDKFGENCTHPYGTLFPQEIPGADPVTGRLGGQKIPPVINIMEEHKDKFPCKPVMKLSPDHEKELYNQLKYYLAKGWITPSTSPYGCAVFFVPKKSGKLRIILDYRGLNAITKKDKFALPDPVQLTTQLAGAKFYSSLDLSHGYHQLVLDESDRPKTAFRTLHGSYQWNVLTFGLTNAVAAFIKVMEQTLRKHIGKCCIVFVDDIIIYSKTLEQHEKDLMAVLSTMQEAQFYVNWAKSEILTKEITYLGHLITPDGVKPLKEKVKAIEEWEVPENIYQVRSFLGAVGYYRKFIHNFSKWAKPLSNLTKDDNSRTSVQTKNITMTKWGRTVKTKALKSGEWTDECNVAFNHLKQALISAPVLKLPNPELGYEMFTDASKQAVGAVLMQRYDGKLHPVAYYSQKLTSTEVNYPVHEFELLAIFKALKHWRHYLINNETLIYTDHKPLTHLMTQETLSPRQQRWITYLADYKVDILAVEGTKNVVADALSRYPYSHSKALTESAGL